jgi:effector-binding domain-containing protein
MGKAAIRTGSQRAVTMNLKISVETRPAHPYAGVRMQVPIPFDKFLQPAWSKVHQWLAGQGIVHGPALIRYLTTDMSRELDIDVGFAIDKSIPAGDGVLTDILPAGRYVTLMHTGPYTGNGVFEANVAIIEWAKTNGIAWKTSTKDGVEWWDSRVEWYLSDPDTDLDPKKYRTELTFMAAAR